MDARVWQFGLVRRAWPHCLGHCPARTRISDHGRARHCLRSFDRGGGVRTGFYRGGARKGLPKRYTCSNATAVGWSRPQDGCPSCQKPYRF